MEELGAMLNAEDVEFAILGRFTDTGRLEVMCGTAKEADIDMHFMHNGVPKVPRKAVWRERPCEPFYYGDNESSLKALLLKVISHPNIASKEEVVRQYDHEVQGGSVIKPFGGKSQDVPQDGCVLRPVFSSFAGIVTGLGVNHMYGRIDPYRMAVSNCEEAARNVAASGGCINRAAFMDNFCWGDTSQPEILGGLVRASMGCYDASKALGIPFVSGKDSLNNFYILSSDGDSKKINIPGTLLITCVAPISDVRVSKGSEFKEAGSSIYLIGKTYPEIGGAVVSDVLSVCSSRVPGFNADISFNTLSKVQAAVEKGLVSSCHDLSDGGLAVSLAEMCFSGIGASVELSDFELEEDIPGNAAAGIDFYKLFSESNSRFLVEVSSKNEEAFLKLFKDIPVYQIGQTSRDTKLRIFSSCGSEIMGEDVELIKKQWKGTIKW
jgi:phosphoribosylformylglycinamidine synthase